MTTTQWIILMSIFLVLLLIQCLLYESWYVQWWAKIKRYLFVAASVVSYVVAIYLVYKF